MSIKIPHSAIDFKKNEIKTLEYINAWGFFNNDFGDLAKAIKIAYYSYKGVDVKKNFNFKFVSDFETEIEGKPHKVVLNALVSGNYEETSYSLGICEQDGSCEFIRRFHFDYDHDNINRRQKAPISHLQYGGKGGIGFDGKEFNTNRIEDWLSVPRLYYPPINIALLLDVTLCEFHNEHTEKIVENPNWRALILVNEVFILRHYYQILSDHILSPRHKKENLVRDICYGI
jgi:hypothetical protein